MAESQQPTSDEVGIFFEMLGGSDFLSQIKAADEAIRHYDTLFAGNGLTPSPWQSVGGVQRWEQFEHGARFTCDRGSVELFWIAPDGLRVRFRADEANFAEPFSYAVTKTDWVAVAFEVDEQPGEIVLRTEAVTCRIKKQAFSIRLERLDGRVICADAAGMQWRDNGAVRLDLTMQPDEACYGLGERASGLNVRGKRFTFWNTDVADHERGSDPLYYNIPFYLGVHNNAVYGVFWDNANRGTVDMGSQSAGELIFEAERGELRYYLFAGDSVKDVHWRYTELTGRIKLPPLWALGYQQSRYSYYPQEQVLEIAAQFRARSIPCDVIYLDIHYMDGYRLFTWDKQRFPSPEQMIDTLHEMGFKVIVIIDPGVKIDPNYHVYRSGIEQDVFLRYPNGDLVTGVVWPGACHFPDFTKPSTRTWWVEQARPLLEMGIDGIWNDMCEPVIFSLEGPSRLPDYVQHDKEGTGGDHLENHNVYGMLMGRSSVEALDQYRPGMRQVTIIRAGWAGAQRYSMSWTGDNKSDWDHLRMSISMTLNMGLSGAPMTGPDVGGFREDSNGELLTRWMQAACFMPYFRNHTALFTAHQEPWEFGQPYTDIIRETIALRYALLPYLYSVVAQCAEAGWPVIAPVFMAEPENPRIRSIDDAYLLGDSILVAPILEKGARKRSLYLPAGQWYDYWTNKAIQGGRDIEVKAPLDRLPLFVRAGTALAHWPSMQHTTAVDQLRLRVYPGDFTTVLYEDRGDGMDYQDGDARRVYFDCVRDDDGFVLNRRVEGHYQPTYKTVAIEVVGLEAAPTRVELDGKMVQSWTYKRGQLTITVNPEFESLRLVFA